MEPFTFDEIKTIYKTVNPTMSGVFNNQQFVTDAPNINISEIINIIMRKVTAHIVPQNPQNGALIFQELYDEIVCLSDIHADILSLVCNLLQAGYMSFQSSNGNIIDTSSVIHMILSDYNTVDVWNLLMTYNIIYTGPHRTCIVFVGDLIDGLRGRHSVQNRWGLNELGIHIILYQLRLSAKKSESQIHIIYGNHELETIIKPSAKIGIGYETVIEPQFVDLITRSLMTPSERSAILLPFYLIDNAMFKLVVNNSSDLELKYIISHGGFNHDASLETQPPLAFKVDYTFDNLVDIYNNISSKILNFTPIINTGGIPTVSRHVYTDHSGIHSIGKAKMMEYDLDTIIHNLITARSLFYFFVGSDLSNSTLSNQSEKCSMINQHLGKVTLIMGHCITHSLKTSNSTYSNCFDTSNTNTTKECIYPVCVREDTHIPNIIFIDNALAIQNTFHKRSEVLTVNYRNVHNKNKMYIGNTSVQYPTSIPIFGELLCVVTNKKSAMNQKHNDSIKIIRNNFKIQRFVENPDFSLGVGETQVFNILLEDAVLLPIRQLEIKDEDGHEIDIKDVDVEKMQPSKELNEPEEEEVDLSLYD